MFVRYQKSWSDCLFARFARIGQKMFYIHGKIDYYLFEIITAMYQKKSDFHIL